MVGDRAAARPDLLREIVRRGHGVGNHSASHPQAWFWALGPRQMREEITRTQATIRAITGTSPRWGEYVAISVHCLDDLPADARAALPVTYLNGRDDDWDNPPADVRQL